MLKNIELRKKAEASLSGATQPPVKLMSADETQLLLHELQVHQIELEMQNDELRRTQLELEQSRDYYFDFYDLAPVGYLTVSDAGLILQANITMAALLDIERQALKSQPLTQFLHRDDQDTYYLLRNKIITSCETSSCELRMKKVDGAFVWVNLNAIKIKDKNGKTTLRMVLSDISERRHKDEELRIAAIAFESQEGIMITDTDAKILRVNKAFTTLTGYSAAEVIGKTPHLLSSGRHDRAFYQTMWASLHNTGCWQGEIWNKRKKGDIYAEWLTMSAVIAPDGRTSHYVGTFSDITKNKKAEAEIHRLAYYDPLTKLPNRRLLEDRLKQALVAAERNSLYGALLFIDLDKFKILNDTQGHDAGDVLLIEVAKRLHGLVREGDSIARIGGDEFVVLLEGLCNIAEEAASQVKRLGKKILASLASPYDIKGYEFYCSASIGIDMFCERKNTAEEILKNSDLAMYKAKEAGRNTLRFFDPSMQFIIAARAAMENDLRHALEYKQFCLYFQSQVYHNRQIIAAEVLIRWHHPEHGLVSPAEFIPIAEETGLILPIGQWVLETACRQLKAWESRPHTRDLQLAVNVSARQFRQLNFVESVQETISQSAINPALLKLELTESMVLDNVADTIAKMNALKKVGVHFSMDDFGTGFSSLAYLTQLPLDQLKIDQSFVRNIGVKSTDAIIVQTIIGMAHNLGIDVIAEGVETEAQRAFLEQHGCPTCQGFLFSKPVEIEKFEGLLKQI